MFNAAQLHLPSRVIKHGVVENGPFLGDAPIKTSIQVHKGFSSQPFLITRGPEGHFLKPSTSMAHIMHRQDV